MFAHYNLKARTFFDNNFLRGYLLNRKSKLLHFPNSVNKTTACGITLNRMEIISGQTIRHEYKFCKSCLNIKPENISLE